jgi:serpin B
MTNFAKRALRSAAWPILAVSLSSVAVNAASTEPTLRERIMAAQGELSLKLLGELAKVKPNANVIVSPASLAAVLSVIDLGGSKELQSNLHGLLGFKKPTNAALDLEGLRYVTGEPREKGPLSSANAILFDQNVEPDPVALQTLSRSAVKASITDFGNADTLTEINKWVSERTKGKIDSVLTELPKDTGLVVLNAIYFKDQWKEKFDPANTQQAPFHLAGGKTVDVPLMRADDRNFLFRQDGRFIAVDLPYASPGYWLTVVTTKSDAAAAKDFVKSGDKATKLGEWLAGAGFADAPGEIALPQFAATANVDLLPTLVALKLAPPSSLPGFARAPLQLGKVQQRVELKVDEEGTEAAAATAVTAERGVPTNYVKLVIDRPFMFALRDARTGLVVVAGYVAIPMAPAGETEAK